MINNKKHQTKSKWPLILSMSLGLLFCSQSITAKPISYIITKTSSYEQAKKEARFPGGEKVFEEEFMKNLHYDAKGVPQRVILKFTIEADGKMTNIQALKSTDPALAAKAIMALEKLPKWRPAVENGKKVATEFYIPMNISPRSSFY